jgi:cholesterol oxidase
VTAKNATADDSFDVLVVGSGFGGSVMAYRLAKAGLGVCVLERGKSWPPGSFPRTPLQFERSFWDPSRGLYGLYDVWSFKGIGALISAGLGGGSLIYANVLLRKDERWFQEPGPDGGPWPITRSDLETHYDSVERVLQPVPYPQQYERMTPKMGAFRAAAASAGLQQVEAPLAVTFLPNDPQGTPFDKPRNNLHHAQRYTCRLVGECDAGCNFGSKNTLDFTYLSLARDAGVEIKCRHEVKTFAPSRDGYTVEVVDYTDVEDGKPAAEPPRRVLFARRLILSAGALGSPYLLLKNHSSFPNLSPRLGTRFCGNGDFLTFAARCSCEIEPAVGTVVTSAVRVPDTMDDPPGTGPGHYIQDGGYPVFLAWIAEMLEMPRIVWTERRLAAKLFLRELIGRRERNLSWEISQLFGDRRLSAGTLPLLGIGRELPQGLMRLDKDGTLDIQWSFDRARPYFDHVSATMAKLAAALGGNLEDNILRKLNAVITVHPVGGCPMGATAAEGVVDPATGEVYNYPRLHVADGSVLPGPVGPNPSLTIAAVADRFAEAILDEERKLRRSAHGRRSWRRARRSETT